MKNIFFILFVFSCVSTTAQDEDSISYDLNLLGDWELSAYVTMNYDGTVRDTFHVNAESVYWYVIMSIEADSVREQLIPTGKQKDLQGEDEKCAWSIYWKEEGIIWISIPCGGIINAMNEIIFIGEEELHMVFYPQERTTIVIFKRIELDKP